MLAACGDESSSSVSPEPRQCEEQSDDCNDVSSSSEKISKNSSSSQKSADKGKSSSSVEKSKSSSSEGKVASSSSKKDENSSSSVENAKESSSSVKPSSSSEAKSSSSGEVKQSSSSVVASSSSVAEQSSSSKKQNPWGTDSEWSPFNCTKFGGCLEFTDKRNNRTYKYLKFEGKDTSGKAATIHAMVENLNIGEMVYGFEDQEDDTKIERYCYKNDTLNCHYYGGLYQWAEMMQLPFECNTKSCADLIKPNHQGICPSGWRLLTYNDYYIVVNSNGNKDGVEGTRSSFGFGGSNDTGYSLVGAGYNWNYSFTELNTGTYWHYPEEFSEETSLVSFQSPSEKYNPIAQKMKVFGFSVRCVMVE
ncbi:MAG: FISUMP domain-containing protein [Fibrobacter sp.]|uniref:FISUMP domain-containing protein n=1 Tax=Fibrobacter sp. TaxID=35828 RepID=UPI002A915F60|nr:FISUMP domain-containing protein [Fibrobacter sp.]MDY6264076.1 FISUMP domain-containing protein [Fibrobacter sp.]